MPGGIPVATVALDGAKNAGILAAEIVGAYDEEVSSTLSKYKEGLKNKVLDSVKEIDQSGWKNKS